MIGKKVLNYLDKNKIKFDVLDHKKVYTAYDLAQTLREDLKKIAKTLLIKADKDYVLVVIPAHYRLDLSKLKKALKVKKVEIPEEKIVVKVLKVKIGGITPFGALHQVETWVDRSLLKTQQVIMNAGSFTQSLRLKAKDFAKLEEAKLGNFVKSAGYKVKKTRNQKIKKIRKQQIKKLKKQKSKKARK